MTSPCPSPCISVCQMHPQLGWCEGCARTIDEIAAWSTLDDRVRWRVRALLAPRHALLDAALQSALPVFADSKRDALGSEG